MVISGTLVSLTLQAQCGNKIQIKNVDDRPNSSNSLFSLVHHQTPSPTISTLCRLQKQSLLARRPTTKTTLKVAKATPQKVCHKYSITVPIKLGDCPFCQRLLLTLEEKHLPCDLKLVDLGNKPEWFLKINPQGKVPVVKLDVQWIADSESLSKILSTFIGFLKSKDLKDGTEQALINELSTINDYLKLNIESEAYFRRASVKMSVELLPENEKEKANQSLDVLFRGLFRRWGKAFFCRLLTPKLYHLEIALGHFKNWSVPDSLPYVKSYLKLDNGGRSSVFDPFSLDIWDPFQDFPLINVWSAASSEMAAVGKASIDWKETRAAHVFKADLPGVKKEEVKVVVQKGKVLQISGERPVEKEESDNWHRVERSSGKFLRRFQLPENAKTEEVKAKIEDGVLTVTVPKQEVNKLDEKIITISD